MEGNTETEGELIREGWTRRFVASEPRLSEAVELYRSMGNEVHLEPLPLVNGESSDEESQECRTCFKGFEDQYKTIYTRPKKGEDEKDDI
jgi:hypothetical protein